jgi:serine protease AprX
MAVITINGISLDPVAQSDALKAARLESPDASQSNYVLIQTSGPLTDEQKEALARLGVEIQEYVPENTYLCRYGPSDLDAIRALPFVVWADVYLEGFKIAPSLRAAPPDAATSVLPTAVPRSPSRKPREVDVVLHDDVDPSAAPVRERLAAAAGVDADELQVGRGKVRLTGQEGQLPKLAALDEVHHIEPVPARQLFNNVARPILHAGVVVNGTQHQGDGEIIAVADTGFDKGSTTNVHPAFTGRVAKLYALGRTRPGATTRTGTARTWPAPRSATGTHPPWAARSRVRRGTLGWGSSRRSTRAGAWAASRPTSTTSSSRPTTATGPACTPTRGARPRPASCMTPARGRSTTSCGTTRTW